MRELSDDECMAIAGPECTVLSSFDYELVRAAYAAGYAAAQSGPLDHQSAATPSTSVGDDAQHGAAQAVTDGPAADPIDDLCERLCALHIIDEVGSNNPLGREAAAILERLRAERDCLKHELAEVRSVLQVTIAARNTYMAERNFLAAIVRAADALFASGYQYGQVAEAYDRARAAWKEEA